jgi:hypothetical protein
MPEKIVQGENLEEGDVLKADKVWLRMPNGQQGWAAGSIGTGNDHPFLVVAIHGTRIIFRNFTSNETQGLKTSKVTKAEQQGYCAEWGCKDSYLVLEELPNQRYEWRRSQYDLFRVVGRVNEDRMPSVKQAVAQVATQARAAKAAEDAAYAESAKVGAAALADLKRQLAAEDAAKATAAKAPGAPK